MDKVILYKILSLIIPIISLSIIIGVFCVTENYDFCSAIIRFVTIISLIYVNYRIYNKLDDLNE